MINPPISFGSGGDIEHAAPLPEEVEGIDLNSGFFEQLTPSSMQRRLSRLYLAAWQSPPVRLQGSIVVAVLQ